MKMVTLCPICMLIIAIERTGAFNHSPAPKPKASGNAVNDEHRREFLSLSLLLATAAINRPLRVSAKASGTQLRDYTNPLLPNWQGTSLLGPLSLSEAYATISSVTSEPSLNMGRWPDPILRHHSSPIPSSVFLNEGQLEELRLVASALRNTARKEKAVGLAAQQCGVDASLVFIDGVTNGSMSDMQDDGNQSSNIHGEAVNGVFGQSDWRKSRRAISGEGASSEDTILNWPTINNQPSQQEKGIFLVNPRIIHRSSESEMLVWTEQCLVLPPEFRATLLRDAEVTIEYETLEMYDASSGSCGRTKQITLQGELARCAQHEMDHDRGVLIVDHVSLDELLSIDGNPFMADIENADGLHTERMQRAYSREVSESDLIPTHQKMVPLAMEDKSMYHARVHHTEHRPWYVQSANAIDQEATSKPPKSIQVSNPRPVTNTNSPECDSKCLEDRKKLIEQRRAMMQQSRSNTRRGDVLKLSEQRASLYGADYRGLPSISCSQTGFCP